MGNLFFLSLKPKALLDWITPWHFGLLMTGEHQARKGTTKLVVAIDPVTMRRYGCYYTMKGWKEYIRYLWDSLGHLLVLPVITVNGEL